MQKTAQTIEAPQGTNIGDNWGDMMPYNEPDINILEPVEHKDVEQEGPSNKRTLRDPEAQKKMQRALEILRANSASNEAKISYAGQNHLLLNMTYGGVNRFVEPYSYRVSGKKGALRFYGYCLLHKEIHSFVPSKIQELHITDQVFLPRWPVEL
jgi:hypothetical protein